jgi:hypothetical protein
MHKPAELLSLITKREANSSFGSPFTEAFTQYFGDKQDVSRIIATAIGCSLFLSYIKTEFPLEKLRTYIYNTQKEYPFIRFDCKSYEPLYSIIRENEILLLNKNLEYKREKVSQKEIFEAFDFITNGQ